VPQVTRIAVEMRSSVVSSQESRELRVEVYEKQADCSQFSPKRLCLLRFPAAEEGERGKSDVSITTVRYAAV
jgi:hypothetical protein